MLRGSIFGPVFVLLMSLLPVQAEEPVWFRHDSGLANDDIALPTAFDASELKWRQPLPPGISSPCVHGNHVYVTTWDADEQTLATVAVDRHDGSIVWRQPAPHTRVEQVHPVGSPAASTPACDGQRVYSFFGSCGLLCYDLQGQLLWHHPMGPFQDEFGASSSPVLVQDLVILNQDHDVDSHLIALDRTTGKVRWKTARAGFTRSYSSPLVLSHADPPVVVVAGSLKLTAYDLRNGKPVWWVNGLSRIVDPTPVYTDGHVFLATWTPGGDTSSRIAMEPFDQALQSWDANGDGVIAKSELPEGPVLLRFFRIDLNQDSRLDRSEWDQHARVFELAQNVALSIRPAGLGDVTESAVEWTYRRGLPTVPGCVVYEGVMYMVKDSGIITTLDATTGKLIRQGRSRGPGNYYASLMAGSGHVYLASEKGVITVLNAGRNWSIKSSHDFKERILATPAIRDGKVYVRTDDALYCFAAAE